MARSNAKVKTKAQVAPDVDRTGDRLMAGIEFRRMTGIHKSTMQRRMKLDPKFPKPVRMKQNRLSFWESEIYNYLRIVQDT